MNSQSHQYGILEHYPNKSNQVKINQKKSLGSFILSQEIQNSLTQFKTKVRKTFKNNEILIYFDSYNRITPLDWYKAITITIRTFKLSHKFNTKVFLYILPMYSYIRSKNKLNNNFKMEQRFWTECIIWGKEWYSKTNLADCEDWLIYFNKLCSMSMLRSYDRIIEFMKIPMLRSNDLLWKKFEKITDCLELPPPKAPKILLTSSLFSCYITSLTLNKTEDIFDYNQQDLPYIDDRLLFSQKIKSCLNNEHLILSINKILIKLTKIISIEYLNDKYKKFFKQPPRKFLSLIIFLTECCLKKNPLELDLIGGIKINNIISEYMKCLNIKSNLDGIFLTS